MQPEISPPRLCECGCGQPTKPADRNSTKLGMVKGEPARFLYTHNSRRGPLAVRFWRLVDRAGDGCWLWLGHVNNNGYGHIGRGAAGTGQITTHRLSWELANGPVPEGMWVLHSCDNRRCVNPAHLHLGTAGDNTREMQERGRERHSNRRLTRADVLTIRRRRLEGVSAAVLAAEYNLSNTHVADILRREAWKDI